MRLSIGTHNLGDDRGTPTLFAALIVFTEALPHRVKEVVDASRTGGHGSGYAMTYFRRQPDLVFVWRRADFKRDWRRWKRYRRYVDGRAKVTPNRGTGCIPLIHRETGRKVSLFGEHRINAAFPPFVRGEPDFRQRMWRRHTLGTLWNMKTQQARGHIVVAAGDCNTPHGTPAYAGFNEAGEHFDRIGTSAKVVSFEALSAMGSDHRRYRAVVEDRALVGKARRR